MEIKSLLFTENVAVFAYPASKTTPSIFQSHQESRDAFWRSAKSNVLLKQYRKNIPSILLLLKVEEMLFLIIC